MTGGEVSLTDVAAVVSEGVRELNHRTLLPGGVSVPDIFVVVGELDLAVHRMGQLVGQLASNLDARVAARDVRLDPKGEQPHDDPAQVIGAANGALRITVEPLRRASVAFGEAMVLLAWVADTGPIGRPR